MLRQVPIIITTANITASILFKVFIKFLLQKTVFGNLILCAYTASYKNPTLAVKDILSRQPLDSNTCTPYSLYAISTDPPGLNTLLLLFTYEINYTGFEVSSISLREPKNPLTDILFSRSLGRKERYPTAYDKI